MTRLAQALGSNADAESAHLTDDGDGTPLAVLCSRVPPESEEGGLS